MRFVLLCVSMEAAAVNVSALDSEQSLNTHTNCCCLIFNSKWHAKPRTHTEVARWWAELTFLEFLRRQALDICRVSSTDTPAALDTNRDEMKVHNWVSSKSSTSNRLSSLAARCSWALHCTATPAVMFNNSFWAFVQLSIGKVSRILKIEVSSGKRISTFDEYLIYEPYRRRQSKATARSFLRFSAETGWRRETT